MKPTIFCDYCGNPATRFLYMPDHLHPEWPLEMRLFPKCESCFKRICLPTYLIELTIEELLVYKILSS